MASAIADEKKALRQQVRKEIAAISPFELEKADDAMFRWFLGLPQVKQARTIFAFLGIPGKEPETEPLLQFLHSQGKRVCLPRMLPGRLMELPLYDPAAPMKEVAFGIREPDESAPLVPREEVDLVLVPAVCYDKQGYRLGFGGGYYDRWLEHFTGFRVGLCRSAILRDKVPTEPHDTRVDVLITEHGPTFLT